MTDSESPSALLERAAVAFTGRADRFDESPLWFTTMPDAVAQPLVEWLREAARMWDYPDQPGPDMNALDFARVILGEPAGHDWGFPYDAHPGARECGRCGAHDDSQPCR